MPVERNVDFKINDRFEEMVLSVYDAATSGKGIFRGGFEVWKYKFLPQWRLPREIEFDPIKKEVRDPSKASQYLGTAAPLEAGIPSRILHSKLRKVWYDEKRNWFFDPNQAVNHDRQDVDEIIVGILGYNYNNPVGRYMDNVSMLARDYNGDHRNLIGGTVLESRERIKALKGVDGISNMLIMQFLDRELASVTDPENLLFKIDTHKARIPLNVGGISFEGQTYSVHHSVLREVFEKEYHEICRKHGLDSNIADSALWVLGSESCSKKSFRVCLRDCVLSHNGLCISNVPIEESTSRFKVKIDGKSVETRKDVMQSHFAILFREGL